MTARSLAAAFASAALAAGAMQALEQQQQPPFRGAANYVRIDVYPLQDGQPVRDLQREEFQVFEDGVPQEIASFEHVVVRPAAGREALVDASTVREARQMAADPRSRLFVLFLDTYHVDGASGRQVRGPLLRLLDRTIGENDMVAVMTPEMSGSAVTFSRRASEVAALLDRYWDYGRRWRRVGLDRDEELYDACYPREGRGTGISDIAAEMIERRREKMTLDAMEDLVIHLQGLRDERKAVLVVSEGWRLYRPDPGLAQAVRGRVPGPPPVGVGIDGVLRAGDLGRTGVDLQRCDRDRFRLSQEDHEAQFQRLLDLANRANASFYPVDPRGLPVFDRPVGAPGSQASPAADQAALRSRLEVLRSLASATDGTAILESNDIDAGLKRIAGDLTSYYLVGYYSTNTRLDGGFREVKVSVRRPGVTVRARRGYLAPTREEVETRTAATEVSADTSPAAAAIARLARIRPNAPLHLAAGYEWVPGGGSVAGAALSVVAELDAVIARREAQWREGAELSIAVGGSGDEPAVERRTVTPAARSVRLRVFGQGGAPLAPGEYTLRVSARPAAGTVPTTEVVHITVPALPPEGQPAAGAAVLFRRGPFSGREWVPAGDQRFSRRERLRMEVPVVGQFTGSATRILDRLGNPLDIPIPSAGRQENAFHVLVGELALAPLAAGDYVLETTIRYAGGREKVIAAFRVTR